MCRTTGKSDVISFIHRASVLISPSLDQSRRQNIFFMVTSPTPGTFVIALHFKGRDKPILEMDLKIDDLLEKVGPGEAGVNFAVTDIVLGSA